MSIGELIHRSTPKLWKQGATSKAPEAITLMKPSLGHVSIPPPRKDQSLPRILRRDTLNKNDTMGSLYPPRNCFPVRVKEKNLFSPVWFEVSCNNFTGAIASSSIPLVPWGLRAYQVKHHINSQNNAISVLLEGNEPCDSILKELWFWLIQEGWRSTNVHLLERGFLGIPIPPFQKSHPKPFSSGHLREGHAIAFSFPSGLTVQTQSLICSIGSALHFGCQESGTLAEVGQAERKRYITAAALSHDVRVWKLKKAWDGERGGVFVWKPSHTVQIKQAVFSSPLSISAPSFY